VQPHSSEEERLRECWLTSDRPNRFVVPYTYIEACKISGKLLKQIFVEEDNQPIRIHVHASIANPNARNLLRSRIIVRSSANLEFLPDDLSDSAVALWWISRLAHA